VSYKLSRYFKNYCLDYVPFIVCLTGHIVILNYLAGGTI
jgi:hypothetical protein